LKKAAEIIISDFGGVVPETVEELMELPGIGHATASAIVAYAFNKPVVFVETNIRTVYLYFYFKNKQHISDKLLAEMVEKTMDRANPRQWYYALTDYGNFLKTKEKFKNTQSKHYVKQSKFKGSNRQVRGMVLKLLTQRKHMLFEDISKMTKRDPQTIQTVIDQLVSEDLVVCNKSYYKIA
jgi:A/G-specific adenine glycosylase